MKKIILIISLSIAMFSCSLNEETTIDNNNLIGVWSWTSTEGGIASNIQKTPINTGKSIEFIFTDNYKFIVTENNAEVATGTYELSYGNSIYSGELEQFITLNGDYLNEDVLLKGVISMDSINNLSILDNKEDGIKSQFEKQN